MKILSAVNCSQLALLAALVGLQTASANLRVVTANDSDGDRIVDTIDVDDDNDGIPDVFEIAESGLDIDSDQDGMPNRLDLDSDNDGILDWKESGAVMSVDFSAMRVVSGRILGEVGNNGYIDALETGIDNGQLRFTLVNTDGSEDDLPDFLDLDSDNDGLPDLIEAGVEPSYDSDNDGRIDSDRGSASVGNDGIPDRLQNVNDETCCDVNGDGVGDIVPRNSDNGDLPDFQDSDSDNDGVSDIIEAGGSDVDGDGRVDNFFDSPVIDGMDDAILLIPFERPDNNGNTLADHIDEFIQTGNQEPEAQPSNVPESTTPTEDDPAGNIIKDPIPRPGENIMSASAALPADDDPGDAIVKTGLNAAGCSVQSNGIDMLLLLLSVLSIAVLGWRNTLRKQRQ